MKAFSIKGVLLGLMTLGLGLTLASCETIDGTLNVLSALQIKTKKSGPWCNPENVWEDCSESKTITLPEGSYSASLSPKSRTDLEIRIKLNGKDETLGLTIPPGKTFPEWNGQFHYTALELDQGWDLAGHVETQTTRSEIQGGHESCFYDGPDWICYPGPPGTQPRCERQRLQGYRYVEYYFKHHNRNIEMHLLSPETTSPLGRWNGKQLLVEKVYTHVGLCR